MAPANPQPRQPGKTTKTTRPSPKAKPGKGLMGWFGRQVGHVKKAVQTDVTKPAQPAKKPAPQAAPRAQGQSGKQAARPAAHQSDAAAPKSAAATVVYREDKIEEAEMPNQPGVRLRRTTIDEVIVVKKEYTE